MLLDEDEVEQAMKHLDEVRVELAAHAPIVSDGDFKTNVLGGMWLLAERGVACDAIQGAARGALAIGFCARRRVQKTIRLELAAYGHEACGIMARAWCHRMQHYLNAEVSGAAAEAEAFPAHVHTSYVEPSEFVRLWASAEAAVAGLARRPAQIRGTLANA